MRKEMQFKLKQLGVVKPHVAIFIIKDLLSDQDACSSQNKKEILERLNTAVSCGEDIIVDLRKNNGATPKFESSSNSGHFAFFDVSIVSIYRKMH